MDLFLRRISLSIEKVGAVVTIIYSISLNFEVEGLSLPMVIKAYFANFLLFCLFVAMSDYVPHISTLEKKIIE